MKTEKKKTNKQKKQKEKKKKYKEKIDYNFFCLIQLSSTSSGSFKAVPDLLGKALRRHPQRTRARVVGLELD